MSERIAVISGGTGFLGRKIAEKFSMQGIKVYIPVVSMDEFKKIFDTSSDPESLNFSLRKIYSFECDAVNENSVIEFVDKVSVLEKGKIDYLVNTVGGINPVSEITDLSTDSLIKMINLNFMSAFYFSREVLKIMKKNNYGRIISIGAIAGLECVPGRFDYSFSKSGVIRLMETISEEMKQYNIRCNTVIPSVIDTPANREWGSEEDIKKWVTTDEISGIICELVSEKFSGVRSSNIKIYGSY
ncbi:MAG: 3-oxoacyl-[acyl-carrier-protein] reductase FabG1 [Ignavibacteria bacterium]|nr:3-oxoacyl-[acyl-carrier-protein] reductase FabG1 [Ignavibacteria bacterium]